MQNLKIKDRLQFIEQLDIDVVKTQIPVAFSENDEKAGYVDLGSLVSFVSGISPLNKQDVLNSTLLAQLAANKAHDRWSDTESWYKFYVNVLEKVGWVLSDFNFTEYHGASQSFTVDKVVLEILRAIASGSQEEVIQETIDALEALSDNDGKLVLFDSNSSDLTRGSFQIASAIEDDGEVAMSLGAFYFHSTQSATRFLWFEYKSSDTHLFKAAQNVNLNMQIYDRVRQSVIDKLGDAAVEFVDELEI